MPVIARAYFEAAALDYGLGRHLYSRLSGLVPEIGVLPPGGRLLQGEPVPRSGGDCLRAAPAVSYQAAKQTLVVAVRRNLTFQRCRPSADWQLPLVTSCPGLCAYCYLQTTLGSRPYIRIYANLEDILARAADYAARTASREGRAAVFEAAATGDPIAVENLTGALAEVVSAFSGNEQALLRVVTKFSSVERLLHLEHRGRTRVRFSINTPLVTARWEQGTAALDARLHAARRLSQAGYPVGLMIAPVIIYEGWREDYAELLEYAAGRLLAADVARGADGNAMTVEVVTHRFTGRARDLILRRHAGASLPMNEEGRRYRVGQFGYGKWVYPAGDVKEVRGLMARLVAKHFPGAALEYVV